MNLLMFLKKNALHYSNHQMITTIHFGVGYIGTVTADDIQFNSCPVKWDAFEEKMKDELIKATKIVIAGEINNNLDGVHAEYNSNVMELSKD
ncbi:MAG TPA: hypothetical protein PLI14_06245 [Bacilli bacterium]|nr:hypothetical protein [Bacilli bacterium]